jgi:pyridoxine/pyridoxamine 5'-phosphate oxidase
MIREHIQIDTRHGGPYDRGSADSYYRRPRNPHFYAGATAQSPRIEEACMTPDEIEAYNAGYDDNEEFGDYKEWL